MQPIITPYIGVDPGTSGAIAALDINRSLWVAAAPVEVVEKANGERTEICRERMRNLAEMLFFQGYSHAIVEGVGGMKKDGASRAFNFGTTTERMAGAFWYAGCATRTVSPQRWKGYYRLLGKPKSASVERALIEFPDAAEFFTPKRLVRTAAQCEGNAEAALIALYGALHHA